MGANLARRRDYRPAQPVRGQWGATGLELTRELPDSSDDSPSGEGPMKFRDPHRTEVSNPLRPSSRARAGPRDPGDLGPARSRHLQVAGSLAIAPSVSVVIPAKNEARNLPHVFASLPQWVDQIVLVDGHSVDGTAEVASRLRPDITIVSQQGRGKGDALLAGFAACTGDIIVTIDADGSTDRRRDRALHRRPHHRRRLRQGVAFRVRRRQRRHHGHAPLRGTRPSAHWSTGLRHAITPTCATATTPSGLGTCLPWISTAQVSR